MGKMRKKILLLDDDGEFLDEIKMLLEESSYDVCICQRPTESLHVIRNYKPDCVVLDLNMPVWNGEKTLSWIQKFFPELTVILCTGKYGINKEQLDQLGVQHLLQKPFSTEALFRILERALTDSKAA